MFDNAALKDPLSDEAGGEGLLSWTQEASAGRRTTMAVLQPIFLRAGLVYVVLLVAYNPIPTRAHRLALPPNWVFSHDLSPLTSSPSDVPRNAYSPGSSVSTVFAPVLTTRGFNDSKGFAAGFLGSLDTSSPSIEVSFCVCLGSSKKDAKGRTFAFPVWSLRNTSNPLKQEGQRGWVSLSVTSNQELVLKDGDGSVVWRAGNVAAMELEEETGNLVLYNGKNETVWQSMSYPGDILVRGQKLMQGKKIVSNNFMHNLEMRAGALFFYLSSRSRVPLAYWVISVYPIVNDILENVLLKQGPSALLSSGSAPVNLTSTLAPQYMAGDSLMCVRMKIEQSNVSYAVFEGQSLFVYGAGLSPNSSSCYNFTGILGYQFFLNPTNKSSRILYPSDFMKLEDDGLIRGYTYFYNPFSQEHSLSSGMSDFQTCFAPDSCGPYGICNQGSVGPRRVCTCPFSESAGEAAFSYLDPSDPSRGCQRSVPLGCSAQDVKEQSMFSISSATFLPIVVFFELALSSYTVLLPDCKQRCMSDCSCTGFFFHKGTSLCVPFGEGDRASIYNISIFSLSSSPNFSTFLKVQQQLSDGGIATASKKKSIIKRYVLPAAVAAFGALFLISSCALLYLGVTHRRRRTRAAVAKSSRGREEEEDEDLQDVLPLLMLPTRYSYDELHSLTKGFTKQIGCGGFGSVYEGVLGDARLTRVAVKRLDGFATPRLKQFLAEVATIGGISHYNIVRLVGFCSERSSRLLVYEYMENGSLDQWLFVPSPSSSDEEEGKRAARKEAALLDWDTRFRVACGTARGLAYLHEECPQPIIHFDVKPQNILLDGGFVPKLSDFGLAKLMTRGASLATVTAVRGTPGYLAPEWLSHAVVSRKCDVYSFGMVLLELVGGRRNVDLSLVTGGGGRLQLESSISGAVLTDGDGDGDLEDEDEWYFPLWAARKCTRGKVTEVVDRRLQGRFDSEQLRRAVHVAFLCIQKDPGSRPSMSTVCQLLEGSLELGSDPPPYHAALEGGVPVFQVKLDHPASRSSATCTITTTTTTTTATTTVSSSPNIHSGCLSEVVPR